MRAIGVCETVERESSVDGAVVRLAPSYPGELRRFAGCFPTGVAVVTTQDQAGRMRGTTMNAVTSLSLDPPMYLLCFGKDSSTLPVLLQSRLFCLNFLSVHQENISRIFASKESDKAFGVTFSKGKNGMPVLDDVVAACEGSVVNSYPGGDHTIVIARIDTIHITDAEPLVFYRGQYRRLGSK